MVGCKMDKLQDQTIETDLFAAAAGLLPGERGALSPLDECNGKQATQKTLQALKKKGLVAPSGDIEPVFRELLQDLLDPIHEFHIDVLNEERENSFSVYFKDMASLPISLNAGGELLAIARGVAFPELITEIESYFSIKKNLKSVFTIDSSLEHAWTLACLLDLSHHNHAGAKTTGGFSPAEIIQALKEFGDSSSWLWLNTLYSLTENQPEEKGNIEGSLDWLVKHGLSGKKGDRYLPAGEAAEITKQTGQPHLALNLTSAQKVNAIHIEMQKLIFFEGQNALIGMAYRTGDESVHWLKRSPQGLKEILEICTQEPKLLYQALDLNTEEIPSIPCPACGQLQDPAAKFCKDCGTAFMTGGKLETIPESVPGDKPQNAKETLRGKLSQKAAAEQDQAVEQKQPVKRKIRWWVILLIILGVILLGCLLVSLFVPITIRF